MRRAKRTCSLTRLRGSASSRRQVRMSTQSVTNAWKSKDPLFSRQRSNVGTLSRTSVTKAPLVPTWCLHASSKAARSSWPNRNRSCCYVCWRQRIGPSHGANTGLSPSRCPLDCTIVEGWRTPAAPNARNTHHPHSCLWTNLMMSWAQPTP